MKKGLLAAIGLLIVVVSSGCIEPPPNGDDSTNNEKVFTVAADGTIIKTLCGV